MANIKGVWGIDIGQCGLKALRCTLADDEETVQAEAFDYIEYPKILSQPEADPIELIQNALDQFLSRNEIRGDKIAISVSGQSGLARFFKPPPVDAKLIPNIVKYEASQQIPFALEDVIWDYQQLGGVEVDGITMETEIGLFAMKRDQVFRAIQPFTAAGVELHHVQLSPLSVYNFICQEVLHEQISQNEIDPENPPESLVVLAIGTETTDLVVTNGTRLWLRSIPLGGNHFTKQLTKEMKLTFAKAEQLKRNARAAEDPKAVFQAMRPVFHDLVAEIQRSLSFFKSIDRQAKIGRMVLLGNTTKLPGLKQYLAKNLDQDMVEVQSFARLEGKQIISSPAFEDNLLSFAVSYGLCLQGLGKAKISTNLLPPEFVFERIVREKKPWAVAIVGVVLLALMISSFFYFRSNWEVTDNRTSKAGQNYVSWSQAVQQMNQVYNDSKELNAKDADLVKKEQAIKELGYEVIGSGQRKQAWLILFNAIDKALPRDKDTSPLPDGSPRPFGERKSMQIKYIESEFFPDLKVWFSKGVAASYKYEQRNDKDADEKQDPKTTSDTTTEASPPNATNTQPGPAQSIAGKPGEEKKEVGPKGAGWVIEISGYHLHNEDANHPLGMGANYLRKTLMKNLRHETISIPPQAGMEPQEFTMAELGIEYVILAFDSGPPVPFKIEAPTDRFEESPAARGMNPGSKTNKETRVYNTSRYDFTIQFAWRDEKLIEELNRRIEEHDKARDTDSDPEKESEQPPSEKQQTSYLNKSEALKTEPVSAGTKSAGTKSTGTKGEA